MAKAPMKHNALGLAACNRSYNGLSLMDRVKEKLNTPIKHIKSFIEPDGQNYESQLPDGYRLHGNTAQHFSAYVTSNALEMHQWHEMEATVHSQFGTVDNPVLIFTSDSSWRIVICMGPGIEDDSHSHEKFYYFVREGPMHRCHICGQCFKIVRLKHENSPRNDYYSSMFADITHFEVHEEDMAVNLTSYFGDRPQAQMQTVSSTNVYIHVNNDEADRIMIDPAYKLERLTEAHQKTYAMTEAFRIVDEQLSEHSLKMKIPFSRDLYETWYNIEKSIHKFDRIFNKVEKFNARSMTDPDNHERREKRMIARRNERWNKNYTFFFGGLTEEEQQYRDYFESDQEIQMEDDYLDEKLDEQFLAATGQFNPALYDFQDYTHQIDNHEDYNDIVEQKIFKYKYRQMADDSETFLRRMKRVQSRFFDRAANRDPALEQNIFELLKSDNRDSSIAQLMSDPENYKTTALNETRPFREYIVKESIQQYKDYYESDDEEQQFFEYLENFSNRDQIRFMELFEDFTTSKIDPKTYVKIPKREYNPQLSLLGNVALDLIDCKDRVRPLSNDISMVEQAKIYQKVTPAEVNLDKAEFDKLLREYRNQQKGVPIDEGYSSGELSEPRNQTASPVQEEVSHSEEVEERAQTHHLQSSDDENHN